MESAYRRHRDTAVRAHGGQLVSRDFGAVMTSPSPKTPSRRRWRTGLLAATTLVLSGAGVAVGLSQASAAACGALSYQAEATLSGSTWTARRGSSTVYT